MLSFQNIAQTVRRGSELPMDFSQFHRLLFDQLGFFAHELSETASEQEICGGDQMGLLYRPISGDQAKSAAWLYAELDSRTRVSKPNASGTVDIEGPRILLAKGFVAKNNQPTPVLELIAVGVVTHITHESRQVAAIEYVKGATVTPQMKVGASLNETAMTSKIQNFAQHKPLEFIYSACGLR